MQIVLPLLVILLQGHPAGVRGDCESTACQRGLVKFEAMGLNISPLAMEMLASTTSLESLDLCGVPAMRDEMVEMVRCLQGLGVVRLCYEFDFVPVYAGHSCKSCVPMHSCSKQDQDAYKRTCKIVLPAIFFAVANVGIPLHAVASEE